MHLSLIEKEKFNFYFSSTEIFAYGCFIHDKDMMSVKVTRDFLSTIENVKRFIVIINTL